MFIPSVSTPVFVIDAYSEIASFLTVVVLTVLSSITGGLVAHGNLYRAFSVNCILLLLPHILNLQVAEFNLHAIQCYRDFHS